MPVVGIGASAGGLNALRAFLQPLPQSTPFAFLVVQHLAPKRESALPSLLQRRVDLTVRPASDGDRIEPGRVYVAPADAAMELDGDRIRLHPRPETDGDPRLIDRLFASLAKARGEHAVAVILSGSGRDGNAGARTVADAGGRVLVQSPDDAETPGMPASAIETGVANAVAPAAELARELVRDAAHDPGAGSVADPSERPDARANDTAPSEATGEATGGGPAEREARRDPAASANRFLRAAEVFDAPDSGALRDLLAGRAPAEEVRAWVVGCATGEGTYGLAMALLELREHITGAGSGAGTGGDAGDAPGLQLFATDIDPAALGVARRGRYPSTIARHVPEARLEGFFRRAGEGYRVTDRLRDRVLFAQHDLLRDPPFSRLDLIYCRRGLGELDPPAQRRAFELMHYALRPGGALFLEDTTIAGEAEKLFEPVDPRRRLYRRRALPNRLNGFAWRDAAPGRSSSSAGDRSSRVDDLHRRVAARAFAPPSVLVDADGHIVHIRGDAGRYLTIEEGELKHELLRMARPALRGPLRSALYRAAHSGEATHRYPVHIEIGDQEERIELTVLPVDAPEGGSGYTCVVFAPSHDPVQPETADGTTAAAQNGAPTDAARLRAELERTQTELRGTVDELELANHDLNVSNEAFQSMNEELQSANEELETSREELQSTNEELVTVNNELREKIDQLDRAHADLANLLASTDIATIFLDDALRIKRFTPAASDLFNLLGGDIGRPLNHITHQLEYEGLIDDARHVLDELELVEREAESEDGRAFLIRSSPYRATDGSVEGVVLTLVDITGRRRAEQELRRNERHYRRALQDSQMVAARIDTELRYTWIYNPHPDFDPASVIGKRDDEIADNPGTRRLMDLKRRVLESGAAVREEIVFPLDIGEFVYDVRGEPLRDETGAVIGLTTVSSDITDRRRTELLLAESEARYRSVFHNAAVGVGRFALDGSPLEVNDRFCEITGRSREALLDGDFRSLTHPDDLPNNVQQVERIFAGEIQEYRTDKRYLRPDGEVVWVHLAAAPLRDADGEVEALVSVVADISARREAEAALRALTDDLEARVRRRTDQVRSLSRELTLAEHRERHRIARTLHDDLQQELYALQIKLFDIESEDDAETRRRLLEEADRSARTAITIGRTLTSELSPPVLEDEGLVEALRWLTSHMHERYGLEVDLETEGRGAHFRLPTDLRVLLFQTVRELLFNVVKHAGVGAAQLRVVRRGDRVGIAVIDAGVGIDPDVFETPGRGLGLSTLRRRLELLGGTVEVSAREPSGTRVEATLPVGRIRPAADPSRSDDPARRTDEGVR